MGKMSVNPFQKNLIRLMANFSSHDRNSHIEYTNNPSGGYTATFAATSFVVNSDDEMPPPLKDYYHKY